MDDEIALRFLHDNFPLIEKVFNSYHAAGSYTREEMISVGFIAWRTFCRKRNQTKIAKESTVYWFWLRKAVQNLDRFECFGTSQSSSSSMDFDAELYDTMNFEQADEKDLLFHDLAETSDSDPEFHTGSSKLHVDVDSFKRFYYSKRILDVIRALENQEEDPGTLKSLHQRFESTRFHHLADRLRTEFLDETRRRGATIFRCVCRNGHRNVVFMAARDRDQARQFSAPYGTLLSCEPVPLFCDG